MITDSQVGIQRPSALRRAGTASRVNGVFGVVTNHYVAKLVSLLFAAVLVALIDRELETTLLDADFDVQVGAFPQTEAGSTGRRQIILEPESGISVRFVKPARTRVTIRGPQKLTDAVKKVLVATVPIKAQWLNVDVGGARHSINRTIEGQDVKFAVPGVEISLDPPVQVDLDPEVTREVLLQASPKDVAPGFVATVEFEPPRVRVLGPETLFGSGGIEQITIAIPTAGRTTEFTHSVLSLPDEVLQKHVRMVADQGIDARVRFSKGNQDTIEVKDIGPIRQVGTPGSEDYAFSIIGLPKNAVNVILSGTPEAVNRWKSHLADLRKQIRAEFSTDQLLSKAISQPGTPISDYVDVEVVHIPDDLKLSSVTPAQVEVSVTKK
jgi:hypothetical protein